MTIYFTISNIHDYGKGILTKSGDMNVVNDLELARGNEQAIIYCGISDDDLIQLKELYPDLTFIHFLDMKVNRDDILVTPMIYNKLENEQLDDELEKYLKFLNNSYHVLLNICRWESFYDDVINDAKDARIKELLEDTIQSSLAYVDHNPSMRKPLSLQDVYKYSSVDTQLLSYDLNDEYQQSVYTNRCITFNRPGSTKGFFYWLIDTYRSERGKDDLYVGNISGLSSLSDDKENFEILFDVKYEDAVEEFSSVDDYLERVNNPEIEDKIKIINSSYTSSDIDRVVRDFEFYGVTTDYMSKIDGDYAVIEYTMLEALSRGLKLVWYTSSMNSMKRNALHQAFDEADYFNRMTYEEQLKYFAQHYSKDQLLSVIMKAIKGELYK